MRILLLRHAETEWNRERRFQGWRGMVSSVRGRMRMPPASRTKLAISRVPGARLMAWLRRTAP